MALLPSASASLTPEFLSDKSPLLPSRLNLSTATTANSTFTYVRFKFTLKVTCDLNLLMKMIYLDDLTPPEEKKERRHTVVLSDSDDKLIHDVRNLLGSKNTAEIMRRAIRAGLTEALKKFKPKAS